MSLKIEFVERADKGEPIAQLCREFSISRPTGHKWLKRFRERGYEGLEEESRRPKSAPLATAEDIVIAVLQARDAHPTWGPKTLVPLLRRRLGELTPSERTVCRILQRAARVKERRKRRNKNIVERAPEVEATAANDLWTIDFKGWWRVNTGSRCEPLTVRDAYSRFILETVACSTKTAEVRGHLERLFRKYGVPKAIQCDNGPPFISVRARAGLSQLSAWWVSLGIRVVRSRLACPQDNGAHERMHRDIKAQVQSCPASDLRSEQCRLNRWRQEFNHVRPHQALQGRTPAEVYKPTEKRKLAQVRYAYPAPMKTAQVHHNGMIFHISQRYFLSESLYGYRVGIEYVNPLQIRVWFHDIDLGLVEIEPSVDDKIYDDLPTRRRQKRTAKATRGPVADTTATVN
jgi:transposase InsO family protein